MLCSISCTQTLLKNCRKTNTVKPDQTKLQLLGVDVKKDT